MLPKIGFSSASIAQWAISTRARTSCTQSSSTRPSSTGVSLPELALVALFSSKIVPEKNLLVPAGEFWKISY